MASTIAALPLASSCVLPLTHDSSSPGARAVSRSPSWGPVRTSPSLLRTITPSQRSAIDSLRASWASVSPRNLAEEEQQQQQQELAQPVSIPSLQELCAKAVRRHLSVYNCLELYGVTKDLQGPAFEPVAAAALRYAVGSYETLKGVRPVDQLRAVLPPDVYGRLAGAAAERKEQLAGGRRLGRVVEAQAVAAAEAEARDVPSVAGHPRSYAREVLLAGVVWPPDVDPSHREEHLSPQYFEQLFGMGFEQYQQMAVWRRQRAKKELKLF